jgi:CAAX prenyl protease-like protein
VFPPSSSVPYVAPFVALILFLWGGQRLPLGGWEYPLRSLALASILWFVSRRVISLRAAHPLASVGLGVAVFLVWIAPDWAWPGWRSHWLFVNPLTGAVESSVPAGLRNDALVLVSRTIRGALLVPVIEELFWRSWLMRWLVKPEFEHVPLGSYTPFSFWMTAALFAVEHGPFWFVGLLAGIAYNWWMIRTRSLGDCIVAHSVTNGALAAYVLAAGKWEYW